MKRLAFFAAMTAISIGASLADAQTAGVQGYPVSGKVVDRLTREAIPYAVVVIVGVEGSGTQTDSSGVFTLQNVKPGIIQLSAIQLGYRTVVTPEYKITPYTPFIEIEME